MMSCNVLVLHLSFYGFLVLNIWWQPCLSIVMNVKCFHGEKHFLCKFVISTLCLVIIGLKILFYLSSKFQNSLKIFLNFFRVWNELNMCST
jgi:hypothetical protein